MTEIRTTASTQIPVTVIEARKHLRVDLTDDDVEIYNLIRRATEYAEDYTGRAFCDQVFTKYCDAWAMKFALHRRPIVSVDSVKYIDANGTQQTLATSVYRVDTAGGRITLAYGQSWPMLRYVTNAVEIAYTAGYGTTQSPAGVVPEDLKHAVLMLVASWYEQKEDFVRGRGGADAVPTMIGARSILDANRVYAI